MAPLAIPTSATSALLAVGSTTQPTNLVSGISDTDDDTSTNTDGMPTHAPSIAKNYDPIAVWSLAAFLLLSVVLFAFNTLAAVAMHRKAVHEAGGKKQPWFKSMRAKLNLLQVFGSFMNVLNQTYFLVLQVVRHVPCAPLVTGGGFLYTTMIMSVSTVMIQRSTTLLRGKERKITRAIMYFVMLLAATCIASSNALRTWNTASLAQGICAAIWNRTLNVAGKLLIVVVYVTVLVVFVRPLYTHSRSMQRMSVRQENPTNLRLETMVRWLFIKIVICISAMVVSVSLGFVQVFGNYVTVEFSIQNCAMVYASTLALERFGRRRTMSGDSSSGATLMNGAPPGSGMDYALPAIGHTGGGAAGVPGGAIRPAPGLSKHLSSSSTATLPPGATARLLQQQPQYGGESAGAPSSAAAGLAVMHSPPMPPAVLPFAPAASLIAAQNRAKRASAETMFRAAAAAASPTPSHPFPSTTAVTGSMPPEYQLKRATLERDAKEEDEEDESTTAGRSSIGGAGIAKSAGPKSTATTPPVRMQRVASGVWAIDDDEMSMMVPDAAAMAVAIELGEMGIGAGGRMVDDECEVAWDESETDVVQVDEEDRSRTEYF